MTAGPIGAISPTRAWRLLECPHAVGLQLSSTDGSTARRNPAATLGTVAHGVLTAGLASEISLQELTNEWFKNRWSAELSTERPTCSEQSDPRTWYRYSAIQRGTKKALARLKEEFSNAGVREVVLERELRSTDGRLFGKPDVVVCFEDGTADVIDYKTAENKTEADEQERFQLLLYSVLIEDALGVEVTSNRIVRADGLDWSGKYRRQDGESLRQQVYSAVDRFNGLLPDTESLARLGAHCGRCGVAPRCEPVWRSTPEGFVGVRGVVVSLEEAGRSRLMRVAGNDQEHQIIGVPNVDVSLGMFCSVAPLTPLEGGQFRWDTATRAWCQAPT